MSEPSPTDAERAVARRLPALAPRAALCWPDVTHPAWRMLDAPCAVSKRRPRVLEYGLLQRDLVGEPLSRHRSQAKWTLGVGCDRPRVQHGSECATALGHERESRWPRWRKVDQSPLPAAGIADDEWSFSGYARASPGLALFRLGR